MTGAIIASVLFALSSAAFAVIIALAIVQIMTGRIAFWPPEHAGSWSHRLFRGLFRAGVYPLALGGLWHVAVSFDTVPAWRFAAGIALVGLGFAGAFYATSKMGWSNAFGEAKGLITDGVFSVSRNPVYVATWVGLIGLAILIAHPVSTVAIALWAVLYLIAPILEEPWLEAQYGAAFQDYKQRVRRFF